MRTEIEELKNITSDYISIKDTCEILKVSRYTVYRLLDSNKLKGMKVSARKTLISLESIKNFLQQNNKTENENE